MKYLYIENILNALHFTLLFFYGAVLSVSISGGPRTPRERRLLWCLAPISLLVQGAFWMAYGTGTTTRLYPLLVHVPLLVVLVFVLKEPVGVSVVSICTAYLCCQLPRCARVGVSALTGSPLAGDITYIIVIMPILLLLMWYFVPAARAAINDSRGTLYLFGGFPVVYYIVTYATEIYTDLIYHNHAVITELMPTIMGLFYLVYTTAYRQQLQRLTQAELLSTMMAGHLKQAEKDMAALRQAEAQSAAYQHDMRHHLTAIGALLSSGRPGQAEEYIRQVQADIQAITPKRFCENELMNLMCSSFSSKAQRMGIRLSIKAALPGALDISDTELCALLSNGLENALNAVNELDESRRWVELYCGMRLDKLLIEIKNPYTGQLEFRDGLPSASLPGHGHGCRSILTITQRRRGLCEFSGEGGVFTLRVALPMANTQ